MEVGLGEELEHAGKPRDQTELGVQEQHPGKDWHRFSEHGHQRIDLEHANQDRALVAIVRVLALWNAVRRHTNDIIVFNRNGAQATLIAIHDTCEVIELL